MPCSCKGGCSNGRCSCVKNNKKCSISCKCKNCQNKEMKKSEKPKEPAYKNDDIQKLEKPNKINFFRRLLSRKSPLQTLPSALVPGDSFSPDKSQKSEEIVEQLPYSATLAPYLPPPLPPPKSLPPSIDISEIRRQQLRRLSYRLRSQTNEISPIKKFEMSSIKNEQASEEQHFDDFHTVNESESSASKQSTSKESKMTILLDNSSEDINDQNMSVSSLNANDQGRKCFTNKKIDEEPDEKMGSIDDISENVYQKEIVAEDEEKEEKYDATDFNETDETKMMEDSDDGKSSNSIDERSCDQLSETNFQERMETDESTELKSNEPMEHISFSLATPSASSSSSSSFVHPDSFSIHPLHQIHSQSIFHSSPSSAIFSTPISISNPNPRVLITSPLISSPSLNSAAAFNLVSPALLSAISPHSSFAYSPHPSASSNSSQSPILSSHSSQSHSLSSSHISPARSSLSPQPSQPPSQLPSPFSQLSSLFSDLSPSSMNISPSTSFPRPLLLPELTQKERKAQLQCDLFKLLFDLRQMQVNAINTMRFDYINIVSSLPMETRKMKLSQYRKLHSNSKEELDLIDSDFEQESSQSLKKNVESLKRMIKKSSRKKRRMSRK